MQKRLLTGCLIVIFAISAMGPPGAFAGGGGCEGSECDVLVYGGLALGVAILVGGLLYAHYWEKDARQSKEPAVSHAPEAVQVPQTGMASGMKAPLKGTVLLVRW